MRTEPNPRQQPTNNNGNGQPTRSQPTDSRRSARRQQQQPPAVPPNRRIPAQRRSGVGVILGRVLSLIVEIASIPMHIYVWLVSPEGSQLVFFGLGFILFGLSVESYAQAAGLPYGFIVKPFINDGAQFENFFAALFTGAFWVATIVSLAVQTVESWLMRDTDLDEAQADYEAVKHHQIPEPGQREPDEVRRRRLRYERSGTKTSTQKVLLLLLVYVAIDIPGSYQQYPFLSVSTAEKLPYLVYFFLCLFGTEFCINLWRDARRKARAARKARARQVEVLN